MAMFSCSIAGASEILMEGSGVSAPPFGSTRVELSRFWPMSESELMTRADGPRGSESGYDFPCAGACPVGSGFDCGSAFSSTDCGSCICGCVAAAICEYGVPPIDCSSTRF